MKYLTALFVFGSLLLLDLVGALLCILIVGLFIVDETDYPYSFTFAKRMWL